MRGQTSPSAKKNAISRAADSTESEPWVPFSVKLSAYVSAQGTRQGVCRIGGAQQVTVTLYRISPSRTETTIGPEVYELNQTVEERATFRAQHRNHEPVQRSGAAFWC